MTKKMRYKPTVNRSIFNFKQQAHFKIQSRKKQLVARAN